MLRPRITVMCVWVLLFASTAFAQSTGSLTDGIPLTANDVHLSARDVRGVFAQPGSASNLVVFTADPSSSGGDVFDVITSDARVRVSLVLPDGREINAATANASGFSYSIIEDGGFSDAMIPSFLSNRGTHTLIVLPPSSPPGTYKVKGDASAVTGVQAGVLILASYFSSSTIRAGVKVKPHYKVGETIALAGLLFNEGSPVTGATVTATVEESARPNVPQITIPMPDSGTFDNAIGDGIYTGTFSSDHPGKFAVAIRSTGTSSAGVPYSRVVTTSFRVMQPLAKFGSIRDRGEDDDFDNLIDRVVITADADVQTAGKYQFGLTLQGSNGREVNTSSFASLAQGSQQIAVTFSANDLLGLGVGGPYMMKNAILTFQDDRDRPVADFVETIGNTAAYSLSSLERPALLFTGQNTTTGLDTDRNGKYNALRIEAEVLALYPGYYEWSGALVDSNGREIDFYSANSYFDAGSNFVTFNFAGDKIGSHGVNGPYSLRSVFLFGADESAIVNNLMDTPPFSFRAFENSDTMRLGEVTASGVGGDGDEVIEPGENSLLSVPLINAGGSSLTGVKATLTTSTPGVTIKTPDSLYPDLPASSGRVNTTPFAVEVAGDVPCGRLIDLKLTVSYGEDGGYPSVFNFQMPVGRPQDKTMSYTGPAVPIYDYSTATVPLTVGGINGSINDINFRFDGNSCSTASGSANAGLDHTYVGDLVVTLTSPRGTTVTLIDGAGGGGNNFCNTLLDDEAKGISIQETGSGSAPFSGAFKPASPLAAFRGEDPNGRWTLRVSDTAGGDIGSVRAFSLIVSGSAQCDVAGDVTAPTTAASRSASPNAAGWNNGDVTVTLRASDNTGGTGVREITYNATGAQTGSATVNGDAASLAISVEGETTVTFSARDNAGNVEATQIVTIKIDKTAPSITVNAPSRAYLLRQSVTTDYTCTDAGSGALTCEGTLPSGTGLDTATTGARSFTVTATDIAGNTATKTVEYAVAYGVRLKYDPNKAHKSGSTVPVKLQLVDANGVNVSSAGIVVTALGTAQASTYAPGPLEDAGNANPDDNFRFTNFDGDGGYIFNLKTTGMKTGTYVLIFRAGADPVAHTTDFQIK